MDKSTISRDYQFIRDNNILNADYDGLILTQKSPIEMRKASFSKCLYTIIARRLTCQRHNLVRNLVGSIKRRLIPLAVLLLRLLQPRFRGVSQTMPTFRSRSSFAVSATLTSMSRSEWDGTVYPCVPGHEIVGRVTKVGSGSHQVQARRSCCGRLHG